MPKRKTIYDLGYSRYLTKDYPLASLDVSGAPQESGLETGSKSSWWDGVTPDMLSGGGIGANIELVSGYLMSENYVADSTGWKIDADGNFYANSGTFRGSLIAGDIHIPSKTDVNSFHTNSSGDSWWGCTETSFNADPANAVAYVLKTGVAMFSSATITGSITATSGTIAGWDIAATTLTSSSGGIVLDDANEKITVGASNPITIDGVAKKLESDNYVSGAMGAGFHLDEDLLEVGNIACRGLIRTAVFQKDVLSVNAGSLIVAPNADVLATDMDATDAETLTIKGTATFAVGDFLRAKDGTDDEWFEITSIASAPTYSVNRDKAGDYGADANPQWKAGISIVNYGQSGDGGLLLTASETNAPYMSVYTHSGSPWSTLTTRLRIGNLNGYLGYSTDLYGIGIGDTTNYIKYDSTNGIRMACSGSDALVIDYGSDILLKEGGDIKFTSVTKPTACTAALIEDAGNVNVGTHKYKITYVNASGETELGSVSNTVTNDGTHKQNSLTDIPTSSSSSCTARKIYRTKAGAGNYYLLTTISNNTGTTYTDNTADASLGSSNATNRNNDSFGKIIVDDKTILSVGTSNIYLGRYAGYDNVDGYNNTFIGGYAGTENIEGSFNTFIGYNAGFLNDEGWYNTFIGMEAGYNNTYGNHNTLIGYQAGYSGLTGCNCNSFMGAYAGYGNTVGDFNTFIGYQAGYTNSTGVRSVFLGHQAGYYETQDNKLFIDNQMRTNEADARVKALIYGVFDAATANQSVTINGDFKITGSATGIGFVDRGDPVSYDWTQATLTTDGTWRDLDCSSIVPAGAKAIVFSLGVRDGSTGMYFQIRKKGNSNPVNTGFVYTQTANITNMQETKVACDSDRKCSYRGSNTAFTNIYLAVKGWFL